MALALLYLCLSGSSTDPGLGLSRRDMDKVGTRHKFMITKRDKLVSCLQAVDWKSVDLLALQLPGDTVEKAGLVTVRQDRLQVLGAEVFTQVTVLILWDTLYISTSDWQPAPRHCQHGAGGGAAARGGLLLADLAGQGAHRADARRPRTHRHRSARDMFNCSCFM